MKMPKELKTKWLEALRSGEYKQTQGALECDGSYCCLGVLQMVAEGKVETVPTRMDDGTISWESKGLPTPQFYERHGIVGSSGSSSIHPLNLVEMNDGELYTFEQIADVIEEKVEVSDEG